MTPPYLRCHEDLVGPVSVEVVDGSGFLLLGHTHPSPHLLVVLHGDLAEDGRSLRRGDARLSPGGDEHFVRGLGRARCLLILGELVLPSMIDARLTDRAAGLARLGDLVATACLRPSPSREDLAAAVDDLLQGAGRVWARSGERRPPAWLLELRRRLENGPEASFSVTRLARRAGVSREHLSRSFRTWYGTSISAFLRDRRLAGAWRLLVTTDRPLAEVASDSGFADQSHLTRQLRTVYGLTPATLRRRSRPGITFVQDARDRTGDDAFP